MTKKICFILLFCTAFQAFGQEETTNDPNQTQTHQAEKQVPIPASPAPSPPPPPMKKKEEDSVYTKTAKRGPIYPGCGKYADDKRELYRCFNENFINDYKAFINREVFKIKKGTTMRLLLILTIDKNGDLHLDKVSRGNVTEEIVLIATEAFNKLAIELKSKNEMGGLGIQPAIDASGQAVEFKYALPIVFSR